MEKRVLNESVFVREIVDIIRAGLPADEIRKRLRDYHNNDIAQSLELLSKKERLRLYTVLGNKWISEIISYVDDADDYIDKLGIEKLAEVVNEMDADDAVDLLENVDESIKAKLRPILDEEVKADIQLIHSYDEDEIGSLLTTNFICIRKNLTIRQATHELIMQAGENDNIGTIYVVDEKEKFCGAIDLKDLIVAREGMELDSLISYSYPYLYDHEKISESIENKRLCRRFPAGSE